MSEPMRVARAGFAPVKGVRHLDLDQVVLDEHGPVGDREWCLVDLARGRVLRSIGAPMMAVVVEQHGDRLTVALPDGRTATDVPAPTGARVRVDYWGREVLAEVHSGAAADLLAGYLDRPVHLARVPRGGVVYSGPVSLVGTASMADVAVRLGRAEVGRQTERLRPTFVIETDEPYLEDAWAGRRLHVGAAVLGVGEPIGRCGVVNMHPATGDADVPLLKALADYRPRNTAGEPLLAMNAVVLQPGVVRRGDVVRVCEHPKCDGP